MINNHLADAIERRVAEATDRMISGDQAVITAIDTNPKTVTVAYRGGSLVLPYMATYTPVIGDVVWCMGPANAWLVQGKVAQ